jgi:hypothetical protein
MQRRLMAKNWHSNGNKEDLRQKKFLFLLKYLEDIMSRELIQNFI